MARPPPPPKDGRSKVGDSPHLLRHWTLGEPEHGKVEASRPDFDAGETARWIKTPEPGWVVGKGLNGSPYAEDFRPGSGGWRGIDPEGKDKAQLYKLMISAIAPRPIAFMSTLSPDGTPNLAPMSYFNMVSHNPPTIMVSIQSDSKSPEGLKDTSRNVLSTRQFCCSIISETFVEAANYTSIDAPPDISEWDLSGLTPRQSEIVKPPHVAESAFSMECELSHAHELRRDDGVLSNTVVFGRVKRIHAKEFLFDPEDPMKVVLERLRPVTRLGGLGYGRVTEMFDLPRPVWDKVKDAPEVRALLNKRGGEFE
ncbi:hypothetical protein EHS25_001611 [Saitozyma podzolica]|uniref:Flavin reductase like domain-containing protein n=1 Tax=Saitozyma podzolica TaxID=1890683 RepID=A0A427YGX7_9TREE|nr:hypothetical protein EHS25_001611 [Saitozyma podzolica]